MALILSDTGGNIVNILESLSFHKSQWVYTEDIEEAQPRPSNMMVLSNTLSLSSLLVRKVLGKAKAEVKIVVELGN